MHVTARSLWVLLPVAIALGACSSLKQTLANKECRLQPGNPYDIVTIDLDQHAITLLWKDEQGAPLLTLARARAMLQVRGDSVLALTNGGIYTRDYAPLGLYVEDGKTLMPLNAGDGYGNFYLKPNGVFMVTGTQARIMTSNEYDAVTLAPDYAIQSGPILVRNGEIHPAFTLGSSNCRLRSGIGVNSHGQVYLAISNGAVNFYDFATLFKQSLGCNDALYLDGAISALYAPMLEREKETRKRYATFLAVTTR